jgi:hypothetical protein
MISSPTSTVRRLSSIAAQLPLPTITALPRRPAPPAAADDRSRASVFDIAVARLSHRRRHAKSRRPPPCQYLHALDHGRELAITSLNAR